MLRGCSLSICAAVMAPIENNMRAKTQPPTHATPTSNEPSQKAANGLYRPCRVPQTAQCKKTSHQKITHFALGPGDTIAMTQNLCACLGELVDKICSGDPKQLEAAGPMARAAPAAPAPAPPAQPPRALPVEAPAATLAVPNVPLETEKSEVGRSGSPWLSRSIKIYKGSKTFASFCVEICQQYPAMSIPSMGLGN